jgi:hypothetical protein
MSASALERRVAILEGAVAALEERVKHATAAPAKKWWEHVAGSMADYPEFEEVMESIRRDREREIAELNRPGNS